MKTKSPQDLLARLVAFDTTSSKSNMELVEFVQAFLGSYGVKSELVPDETGRKANLFATIGPSDRPGIGLSGHTDVVPVEGQDWDHPAFELTKRDGRLYGRGACDMKGFIACVLAQVPRFTGQPLKTPIHLLFSYDEEVGCTGVRPMIAQFGERFVRPALVIVGEPTNMKVVDAHKATHVFKTTVQGREAHSSQTQIGVNAIVAASKLVAELDAIASDLKTRDGGERFTPPYTTIQIGTIQGGTMLNIVPNHCRFLWEFRAVPDQDLNEIPDRLSLFAKTRLLPDMQKIYEFANIETRPVRTVPGLGGHTEHSTAVSLALKLAGQNDTFAVSYATEAGLFEQDDSPAVVCGPGDIAQAHKPDEYVEITQLEKCTAFLDRLTEHVCA